MQRYRSIAAVAALLTLLLSGCATGAGGTPVVPPTSTGSPSPTCAAPAQPGVEPPEGCVIYDPEHAMAQNEKHRERVEITDAGAQNGEDLAVAVRASLDALRSSGDALTDTDVRAALVAGGIDERAIQTLEDYGAIKFGATFSPADGGSVAACIFGSISPDAVSVDVGGLVLDGGCLAMDGH